MPKLFLVLVAAFGLASCDKKGGCRFVPTASLQCKEGCFVEKTKLCAIDCSYAVDVNGKCVKDAPKKQ